MPPEPAPLEPEIAALLAQAAQTPSPPPTELAAYRAAARRSAALLPLRHLPLSERLNLSIPVPTRGGRPTNLDARLYVPEDEAPTGLLVYFHGGGWIASDLDTHDGLCTDLASVSGVRVLSVAYRLAPESPYPGPLDDCWQATRWAAEHARELGAGPARLAVGGDSAGGNLAAAVALRAREEGGPPLQAQLLIYPATNLRDQQTPSWRENATGYALSAEAMAAMTQLYVQGVQADEPYASPALAPDLSRLPPALVLTAGYDPLRDDGDEYARLLAAAGVAVTHRRYAGLIHTFARLAALSPGSAAAMDAAALWLKETLR